MSKSNPLCYWCGAQSVRPDPHVPESVNGHEIFSCAPCSQDATSRELYRAKRRAAREEREAEATKRRATPVPSLMPERRRRHAARKRQQITRYDRQAA